MQKQEHVISFIDKNKRYLLHEITPDAKAVIESHADKFYQIFIELINDIIIEERNESPLDIPDIKFKLSCAVEFQDKSCRLNVSKHLAVKLYTTAIISGCHRFYEFELPTWCLWRPIEYTPYTEQIHLGLCSEILKMDNVKDMYNYLYPFKKTLRLKALDNKTRGTLKADGHTLKWSGYASGVCNRKGFGYD